MEEWPELGKMVAYKLRVRVKLLTLEIAVWENNCSLEKVAEYIFRKFKKGRTRS
jgi:hypothetical protein